MGFEMQHWSFGGSRQEHQVIHGWSPYVMLCLLFLIKNTISCNIATIQVLIWFRNIKVKSNDLSPIASLTRPHLCRVLRTTPSGSSGRRLLPSLRHPPAAELTVAGGPMYRDTRHVTHWFTRNTRHASQDIASRRNPWIGTEGAIEPSQQSGFQEVLHVRRCFQTYCSAINP